jgi:hypothetical protein
MNTKIKLFTLVVVVTLILAWMCSSLQSRTLTMLTKSYPFCSSSQDQGRSQASPDAGSPPTASRDAGFRVQIETCCPCCAGYRFARIVWKGSVRLNITCPCRYDFLSKAGVRDCKEQQVSENNIGDTLLCNVVMNGIDLPLQNSVHFIVQKPPLILGPDFDEREVPHFCQPLLGFFIQTRPAAVPGFLCLRLSAGGPKPRSSHPGGWGSYTGVRRSAPLKRRALQLIWLCLVQ